MLPASGSLVASVATVEPAAMASLKVVVESVRAVGASLRLLTVKLRARSIESPP